MARRAARLEDQVAERISAKVRAIAARSGTDLPPNPTPDEILAQLRRAGVSGAAARKALDDVKAAGTARTDRLLRIQEVIKRTGLSRTTLWRLERKSEFPKRVPLTGNTVAWRESEVSAWIARRGRD